MSDIRKQIMQEYEAIRSSHFGCLKDYKEGYKDAFSFDSIKGLLRKRRESFDYKIVRMFQAYG